MMSHQLLNLSVTVGQFVAHTDNPRCLLFLTLF
jgi:hypothetical protein